MNLREFADRDGLRWQVWETRPGSAPIGSAESRYFTSAAPTGGVSRFTTGRDEGWLTFTSGGERRRLSPIPANWHTVDDRVLIAYLESADRVRSQLSPDSVTGSDFSARAKGGPRAG